MLQTSGFNESIKAQFAHHIFRRQPLRRAADKMVKGDLETAKAILRAYIQGTVGFAVLGKALAKYPKSLMRMLSPQGDPQARNHCVSFAALQRFDGTVLDVFASAAEEV